MSAGEMVKRTSAKSTEDAREEFTCVGWRNLLTGALANGENPGYGWCPIYIATDPGWQHLRGGDAS